ncbi:hypothetical protein [Nonomuraea sp. NPDC050540]|uniref:hypothetical protein n=1 Tax=Nonomuraea sp. NPDC050540 TaxID=3364367 RepID=UPI0037A1680D
MSNAPSNLQTARPPWIGIIVSALSLLAMAVVAWRVWDSLPALVNTREATPIRAGVQVPRIVVVTALPGVLVLIAAIMTVSTTLGGRLRHHVDPRLVASPRSQTRSMNVLFVILPLFLLVLHTGLLFKTTDRHFPLEQAVGVAFGVLLASLGNVLPKISPARVSGRFALAWQHSQRAGGAAMVILGIACAIGVFFLPPTIVVVAAALLIAPIYVLMVLLAMARSR